MVDMGIVDDVAAAGQRQQQQAKATVTVVGNE